MPDPPWMQARDVATFRHPGTAPPPSLPTPPPAKRQPSAHLLHVQSILWYEDELTLELLLCTDSIQVDSIFSPRGQLEWSRFDRVLDTLWKEFKSFPSHFYKFAMKKYWKISYRVHSPSNFRASEESKALARNFKQPTPQSITKEEVLNFKLRDEFETLRSNCSLLYHVICGGLELGQDQLEVTPEKLQITSSLLRNRATSYPVGLSQRCPCKNP